MRIALINEAWPPLVNGVVTTWTQVYRRLTAWGHEIMVVHPGGYRTFPCPRYPEIRLAFGHKRKLRERLEAFDPEAVHIATEGPLGTAARAWCLLHNMPFTTSYHSQFPEYLEKYFLLPRGMSYPYMRRFHGAAVRTLVPTLSMKKTLDARGFTNVVIWSRGVDGDLFQPRGKRRDAFADLPRPIFLCAGRVAHEKNIPAFLALELPGTKVVMGDGPILAKLASRFPRAFFTGYQSNDRFAWMMASADVKVFPSRTDTFGLVMLEAAASGVPVAAYPVCGPVDVLRPHESGILREDLREAALEALEMNRSLCRDRALEYRWDDCARQLLGYLQPRSAASTDSNAGYRQPA